MSMVDSDDLWLPSYLQVMGDVLAGNPQAALAYADAWLFDGDQTRPLIFPGVGRDLSLSWAPACALRQDLLVLFVGIGPTVTW